MSHSAISLGLGLGGGKSATSSGAPGGGGSTPFANAYSMSLDATDDYLSIPASSDYDFGTGAFSFSMWFKISDYDSYGGLFFRSSTGSKSYRLKFQNSAQNINLQLNSGGEIAVVSHGSSLLNSWHHLAIVRDTGDDTIKGYLDAGTPTSNSLSSTVTFSSSGNPLLIGNHANIFYLGGLIDEFAIFNSTLSASNVTDIYNSGEPNNLGPDGLDLSPIGWWRMGDNDGGTGTTITDQGSGDNDGTLTNGATYSSDVPS